MSETTGLTSLEGAARAEVTDRTGWIRANIRSFRRLLTPLFERAELEGRPFGRVLPGPLGTAGRAAAGAELGAVLGWMSTRVLGQYDLLFTEDADSPGDVVYYVGPNVIAIERRHGFPPREFRLWIAIHELTHRAQFTGVPWMRQHFLDLVDRGVSIATPDPKALAGALGEDGERDPLRPQPARRVRPRRRDRNTRAGGRPTLDTGAHEPARGPWGHRHEPRGC